MSATDGPSTSLNLLRMISNPENSSVWDAAWAKLFRRYRPMVDGLCHRKMPNHHAAEEVSAAVWAALVKALPGFVYDPTRSFRAYLRTVVLNAGRMFLRNHKRRRDQGSGDVNVHEMLVQVPVQRDSDGRADEINAARIAIAKRIVASVKARLNSPKTWEAFDRTRIGGEKARQVAKDLGMEVGAVYRAANRVQKLIKEEVARLSRRTSDCPGGML